MAERWVRYEGGFGILRGETIQPHAGDLFDAPTPAGAPVPLAEVGLLPPVAPRCFIGLWNNFHAAAAKQGNAIPETPLYFLKSPGSIVGPEAAIRPPAGYDGR